MERHNTCQDCSLFLPTQDTKPIEYLRAKLKDGPWKDTLESSHTGICQSPARLIIVRDDVVESRAVLSTQPSCEYFIPRPVNK